MGADFAYIGSAFIATSEANALPGYKQAVVDGVSADIVYSSYFTGVHGNYLRGSIIASGLDPENLPEGDHKSLKFDDAMVAKAWRDIWGAGQGIGRGCSAKKGWGSAPDPAGAVTPWRASHDGRALAFSVEPPPPTPA
jgi:NAD(P)H-dependent flavin oxidoreductase YrpB (nitropropane dioxygenase family)